MNLYLNLLSFKMTDNTYKIKSIVKQLYDLTHFAQVGGEGFDYFKFHRYVDRQALMRRVYALPYEKLYVGCLLKKRIGKKRRTVPGFIVFR